MKSVCVNQEEDTPVCVWAKGDNISARREPRETTWQFHTMWYHVTGRRYRCTDKLANHSLTLPGDGLEDGENKLLHAAPAFMELHLDKEFQFLMSFNCA